MGVRRWAIRGALGILALLLLLFAGSFAAWYLLTGPRNLAQYPPASASPYLLPWTAGEVFLCIQSNHAVVSHRGRTEFAYDFVMPVGTDVRAARGGTVARVVEHHDGAGRDKPNNLVAVDHGDGTVGYYLHLKREGAFVEEGETVAQGEVIAHSGHVGKSALPHLHFHVVDQESRKTLPISFRDVEEDRGVPRMFKSYRSGNGTS